MKITGVSILGNTAVRRSDSVMINGISTAAKMAMEGLALILLTSLLGAARSQSCQYSQYLTPGGNFYTIQSPNYPTGTYQPGTRCTWRAYTSPGAIIHLECPYVDMPQSGIACQDQLIVSDTDSPYDGIAYCGFTKIYHDTAGTFLRLDAIIPATSRGGRFSCTVRALTATTPPANSCSCGYSYRSRIVGGVETGINEFPMMVALFSIRNEDLVCGATIITQSFVVTAGHCLKRATASDLVVRAGDHDLSTNQETNATTDVRVSQLWVHPGYVESTVANDIGLVRTVSPLRITPRVGPACLPFSHPESFQGKYTILLGWGTTSFGGIRSDKLQKVAIQVQPIKLCQDTYGSKINTSSQMCLLSQGKDSCQFDSGGPVLWLDQNLNRYILVGIQSYGRTCDSGAPSVNTRVYAYLNWITQIISGEPYCVV